MLKDGLGQTAVCMCEFIYRSCVMLTGCARFNSYADFDASPARVKKSHPSLSGTQKHYMIRWNITNTECAGEMGAQFKFSKYFRSSFEFDVFLVIQQHLPALFFAHVFPFAAFCARYGFFKFTADVFLPGLQQRVTFFIHLFRCQLKFCTSTNYLS